MKPHSLLAAAFAAALLLAPALARAQALTVAEVGAPAVNCVFDPSCQVKVVDTVAPFQLLSAVTPPGSAVLQSRTYEGSAGTPAEGLTAYVYRVNLGQAAGKACVVALNLNFGKHRPLPYKGGKKPFDMFVVTSGGLGSIGVASAERQGEIVTVTFAKPICASQPASQANMSYFFGLASEAPPTTAVIYALPLLQVQVEARVPKH